MMTARTCLTWYGFAHDPLGCGSNLRDVGLVKGINLAVERKFDGEAIDKAAEVLQKACTRRPGKRFGSSMQCHRYPGLLTCPLR